MRASGLLLLLALAGPIGRPPATLPLTQGTYWVYEGMVRWQSPDSGEEHERRLTWRMEVLSSETREGARVARLRGHPMDLAFYEEGRGPREYLLVEIGTQLYLVPESRVEEVLEKVHAGSLGGMVNARELILEAPLTVEKTFGEPERLERVDRLYQWVVEEERAVQVENIKGLTAHGPLKEFLVSFRTVGSHELVNFVPGVGITRYVYGHHGTVSEFDLRLVEIHIEQEQ